MFFMLYYFNNIKCVYLRELYILWILITLLLNIFYFSIFNIIISVFICLALIMQLYIIRSRKEKKIIEKTEISEVKLSKTTINVELPDDFDNDKFMEEAKQLYIDMQKYFTNFEYEKLYSILSEDIYVQFEKQMQQFEKNNKVAVRDNIKVIDFKINGYEETDDILTVKINIGVLEDKYTKLKDSLQVKNNCCYESYYEITLVKDNLWRIEGLKLINSRSKQKS